MISMISLRILDDNSNRALRFFFNNNTNNLDFYRTPIVIFTKLLWSGHVDSVRQESLIVLA